MEQTPEGTPVGVDDPYAVAGICDHLTDDGRCRFALDHAGVDPEFAEERAADGYAWPTATPATSARTTTGRPVRTTGGRPPTTSAGGVASRNSDSPTTIVDR